jgi:hypothetical protein
LSEFRDIRLIADLPVFRRDEADDVMGPARSK